MGRGPGNVKTEILINKMNSFKTKFDTNYKRIDQSLINDFEKLKKHYSREQINIIIIQEK